MSRSATRSLLAALAALALVASGADRARADLAGQKCAAAKIKAATKKASAKLKCHRKAVTKGVAVDSSCLLKAETKFAAAFQSAEDKGGCVTVGDANSVEGTVDAFVDDIVASLPAESGFQCASTNTCGCNSLTIDKPACVATNDLMVAHLTYRAGNGDTGIAPPAGWTSLFSREDLSAQISTHVLYKVATGSEPATYDFAQTANGSDMVGSILVYAGVNVADPIEDAGGQPTSGTSHTAPCITATTDDPTVVALFSLSDCSTCTPTDVAWTPEAGMTERYDAGVVQSSQKSGSGSDALDPTQGCVQKSATSFSSAAGFAVNLTLRRPGATDAYDTLSRPSSVAFEAGASLVLNRPAVVKENDVMLAHLSVGFPTGPEATPPPAWTLIRQDSNGTDIGSWLYYKVAGSAEPASYTFAVSSGLNLIGAIVAYSGIDPASPIEASGGAATSGTSHAAPSITTTSDAAMIVTAYSILQGTSYTPPPDSSERYDYANAQNHFKTIMGADFILTPAGASGTQTATSGASGTGLSQIVALKRLGGTFKLGECCGFTTQAGTP